MGPGIDAIEGPAQVIEAGQDPYRAPDACHRLAERTDAELLEVPDVGHFWMLDHPVQTAAALAASWAGIG